MPNTVSPSGRHGGGRRQLRWRERDLTRADLLTILVAATLCSASYCLAIWHNGRGATDSRVLIGPNDTALVVVSSDCGRGDARLGGAADTDDEPLDFEAHHTAESAGLSVSTPAAATRRMAIARRALRGGAVAPWAGSFGGRRRS